MNAPRVTVLMTAYNAERYLHQAIESTLSQTYADFELLIVDDGSTDATAPIIRSYADPRIRYFRNPHRRGVSPSRQFALEQARGTYVAVLDADDTSVPERLEVQVGFLDAHQDVHLTGSSVTVVDSRGSVEQEVTLPTDAMAIRWQLLFGNCIAHSTVMYRRTTAQQLGGYDPGVPIGEDYDLWVRFAASSRIVQTASALAQWRRHNQSLCHSDPPHMRDWFISTVIKSIRLQTGLSVSAEVAGALFRNLPAAATRVALREAYRTIASCLEHVLPLVDSVRSGRNLVILALGDIRRLTRHNHGAWGMALCATAQCLCLARWFGFLDTGVMCATLRSAVPNGLARCVAKTIRAGNFR